MMATLITSWRFEGRPNRFYRNDTGTFHDVGTEVGLIDDQETRAAAWGDYDSDGDADLYIGFADPKIPLKVYRNDAKGTRFVDVAREIGVTLNGVARQPAWIDYDGDGDLDLFAAFRDVPNRLLRNDRGRFVDVTKDAGIGDSRKTVGAVWWDFDRDGDPISSLPIRKVRRTVCIDRPPAGSKTSPALLV
jgi:hypothetical protein